MKNNIIIFIALFLLSGLISSCEKDGSIITLTDDVIVPTIVSIPNLVLLEENEDDTLIFVGTPVNPGFAASANYYLELCAEGNDFEDAIQLFSGPQDTLMKVSVKDLNEKLIIEFPADEASTVDFRIRCNLVTDAGTGADPIEYFSITDNQEITPYAAVIDYGTVHLLGDATLPGWDNTAALPLTHLGNGVFEITSTLTDAGGVKFLAILGQWAPQWGMETGTWDAGTLFYRPTEDIPDPVPIPAPPAAGDYVITADIVNLTYTIVAAK